MIARLDVFVKSPCGAAKCEVNSPNVDHSVGIISD